MGPASGAFRSPESGVTVITRVGGQRARLTFPQTGIWAANDESRSQSRDQSAERGEKGREEKDETPTKADKAVVRQFSQFMPQIHCQLHLGTLISGCGTLRAGQNLPNNIALGFIPTWRQMQVYQMQIYQKIQ